MIDISQSGMEKIRARFNDMRDQIKQLRHDVPQTFYEWQKDDLHSKNPWVLRFGRRGSRVRNRRYRTIILPHSTKDLARRKQIAMRLRRRKIQSRKTGTTKPILRPKMEAVLWEQLTGLLDKIKW